MKKSCFIILLLTLFTALSFGQGAPQTPQNTTIGSPVITTVAGLATVAGKVAGTTETITDGTGGTDCTVGGGSTLVWCVYNGSTWAVFSSGLGTTLDTITALAASKTIANGNFIWTANCAPTTDSQDCVTFGETSAAINGTLTNGLANQAILHAITASNSTATPLEIEQGSITNTVATPLAQFETTWNNAGLTGRGLYANVTDNNSTAASKLLELAKGNTVQFSVDKNGQIFIGAGSLGQASIVFNGDTTAGFYRPGSSALGWTNGTNASFRTSISIGIEAGSGGAFCWSVSTSAGGLCDTGISRLAAGSLAAGNGSQGDKTGLFTAKRYTVDGATNLVAGDFALSAGWGTTASVSIRNTASKDAAAGLTVTSAGTGQAANPTLTFTFHDGTWTNVPICTAVQQGGNDIFGDTTLSSDTATAFVWIWNGTPTATKTYQFLVLCTGT